MQITYDSEADILYIELRRVPVEDSADIETGVTVTLDGEGHIAGLEILDASKRIGIDQLRSITLKDLAWDAMPIIGPDYRPLPPLPSGGSSPAPDTPPENSPTLQDMPPSPVRRPRMFNGSGRLP